jgi:hypothetical protein
MVVPETSIITRAITQDKTQITHRNHTYLIVTT